jgi:glutathione S-transferase
MEIALYYAPITCALAPYITLTEAGAKFEVRALNFRKGQHTSPDYLKINPKHKVPLLIVDGRVLSESVRSKPGLRARSRRPSCCRPTRGKSCRRSR